MRRVTACNIELKTEPGRCKKYVDGMRELRKVAHLCEFNETAWNSEYERCRLLKVLCVD